jgi:homoserine kinase
MNKQATMSGKTGIKVHSPAAIGNFGAGYHILSAAVEAPGDELIARLDPGIEGVQIESIVGFKKGLSLESELNSAAYAGQLLLDHLGEKTGISLKLHKKIALNSGLSSNASSAVAGVFAVNELMNRPLERYDLIDFAEKAARKFNIHLFPSQVASILFGGIILYRPQSEDSFQKIYCPDGIQLTLVVPEITYLENEKLQFVQKELSLEDRIHEQGNTAAFISSLYASDFNLFGACLQEKRIDPGLLKAYPYFEPLRDLSLREGAFGCGFSGLGPAMYIAAPNTLIAGEITRQMDAVFKPFHLDYKMYQSKIDLNGVYKY